MKKGAFPYTFTGVPRPNSGVKFTSPERMVQLLEDPNIGQKLRQHIDVQEKVSFGGQVSGAKQMIRKQAKHDMIMDKKVEFNRKVIDIAQKKKEGK